MNADCGLLNFRVRFAGVPRRAAEGAEWEMKIAEPWER
jgi:hypothetical protein